MNSSIPRRLQVLLTKLNFLSQITRGFKPCMSNMTLVDASSWFGAFQRSWQGESRKSLIAAVEQIVSETVEAVNEHADDEFLLRLIINALPEAREGVNSLKVTYRDDPEIIAKVGVQLTSMDLQLEKYRDLIKGYEKGGNNDIDEHVNNNSQDIEDFVRVSNMGMSSEALIAEHPNLVRRKRRVKKSIE